MPVNIIMYISSNTHQCNPGISLHRLDQPLTFPNLTAATAVFGLGFNVYFITFAFSWITGLGAYFTRVM